MRRGQPADHQMRHALRAEAGLEPGADESGIDRFLVLRLAGQRGEPGQKGDIAGFGVQRTAGGGAEMAHHMQGPALRARVIRQPQGLGLCVGVVARPPGRIAKPGLEVDHHKGGCRHHSSG